MDCRTLVFIAFVNVVGLFSSVGWVDASGALGLGLLTPLMPLAQITGHAGLMAHGLTGAALLKLKAAAALSGLFLLSGRGFELNLGNQDAGGWGWSSPVHGGWDRRKRSTDRSADALQAYDPSLDQIMAFDQLGCGMRLVCELSAASSTDLGEDEKLILELFGRDGKAPTPGKASAGKLSYTYASILGANAKDGAGTCGRVYGHCPYNRVSIMASLREAQV